MNLIWGAILVIFTGLLCWLIQVINTFQPDLAADLGLNEPEDEVDPAFFADTRGEAVWDVLTLWTLPLAGILLIVDNPLWAYLGLVGGGFFLYFAGRGLVVRGVMQSRGIQIGKPETVKLYRGVLTLWGSIAAVTIALAITDLPLP